MSENKLAEIIEIEFEGHTYTLEFTRASVMKLEQSGFDISHIESEPLTTLYTLFRGAFLAHHPKATADEIDAIFDGAENGGELLQQLAVMYRSTIESLLSKGDGEGKAKWKVVG